MAELKERVRVEVDQDQIALLQSFAEQHHMAVMAVLRNAITTYVGSERKSYIGNDIADRFGSAMTTTINLLDDFAREIRAAQSAGGASAVIAEPDFAMEAPSVISIAQRLEAQLRAVECLLMDVKTTTIAPIAPPVPVSRHPGRDYSSFGSIKRLPDGLEYQNAAREEW